MDKLLAVLVIALGFFVLCFVLGLIMAFPVMWLWNYAAAGALHLPTIDVWHAWALSVLSAMLFKSSVTSSSSK